MSERRFHPRLLACFVAACSSLAPILPQFSHAAGGWPAERTVGPFVCHADFPLDTTINFLEELARLQNDLVRSLKISPPRESIHLFLFHRETIYRSYIKEHFPEVPYRRALFIKDRGPGMVFAHRSDDMEVDLRHEGTHALLHATLPVVPLWLDEGLAEYFEVPASERTSHYSHLSKTRWSVRLGNVATIEQLEQLRDLTEMGQTEYRQAWAWVHFLLHGSAAAHDELMRYLNDIQNHMPPGVLSQRIRNRLPDVEERFARHFLSWRR